MDTPGKLDRNRQTLDAPNHTRVARRALSFPIPLSIPNLKMAISQYHSRILSLRDSNSNTQCDYVGEDNVLYPQFSAQNQTKCGLGSCRGMR